MSTPAPPVVDAHLHLWDRSRLDYPWMAEIPQLPQTSLPEEIPSSTTGAVVIEAGARTDQTTAEVEWLTELSHRFPAISGLVAAVDLTDPHLGEGLAKLGENPLVVGVRDNLEGRPLGDLELQSSPAAPVLRDGIITVLEAGLTFDICVRSAQLPELSRFLVSIVEARGSAAGLVIDHLGKPLPDGRISGREGWAQSMRKLASLPGLHVKFSGLPGQITGPVDVARAHELVRDFLEMIEVFGAQSTMLGTDHPVSTLAHDLTASEWMDAANSEFRKRLTAAEATAVSGGTATDFYGLRNRS
ncbi:amidohydrolase family protein [Brevibacterium sediminis]|uniref:amidohydrolase family protein n=1 Tax=Brevibacterium sediminis TaxID=1857024 RepID=UPI002174FFC8|nr:amidohydrolase family protein [Brevibacterium sediminis]MCS4594616.1 amidohydrolase family protein [Brevibacterium sediminis]